MRYVLAFMLFFAGQVHAQTSTSVSPTIDTSNCTQNQPINYQGPAVSLGCNNQVVSMAGGRAGSTIWVPTATVSIGTSDTSCFSATGRGPGQTITPTASPAVPYIGNTFTLNCNGVFSTPALNSATILSKIKFGSTTVASATSSGLQATATNLQWTLSGVCTILTVSATPSASTITCSGAFTYAQGATGSSVVSTNFQSVTPVSVDTTTAFKVDMTMAWSSVSGGQAATVLNGTVQILY